VGVPRLSPVILDDLIDVLAIELRETTSDVVTGSFRRHARPAGALHRPLLNWQPIDVIGRMAVPMDSHDVVKWIGPPHNTQPVTGQGSSELAQLSRSNDV
jgi:hypothetical protein